MQIHLSVPKPGTDEADRLFVPCKTSEFVEGVLKIDIRPIDAVGLIGWKSLVILFESSYNVH